MCFGEVLNSGSSPLYDILIDLCWPFHKERKQNDMKVTEHKMKFAYVSI